MAKQIAEKSGVALRPASEKSHSALQHLGIPDDVIAFFNEFEPAECADIDGVRIWPAKEVLAENKDYVPGCLSLNMDTLCSRRRFSVMRSASTQKQTQRCLQSY
jgi:hypothetical protein